MPCALGYVVIYTDPDTATAWRPFATDVLGLMVSTEPSDGDVLRLRMDERSCRIAIVPAQEEDFALGWEYENRQRFEAAAAALSHSGVVLKPLDADELKIRGVAAALRFVDPSGATAEIFYGPDVDPITHFVSQHGVTFLTGDGGFGHGVLLTNKFDETIRFYEDVLGFRLRDEKPGQLAFMGCNPREHSLAVVFVPDMAKASLMHLMIEATELDDVGRAMDRCLEGATPLTVSLGKHWNDHMVSFYLRSPSGFDIEYGWGAKRVEGSSAHVRQAGHGGASLWGHRVIMPNGALGPNVGKAIEL
jgi:3,4-dihydroxy-9,10-secoandrosta-1,3,5(10)-triene-9,17-dione 4,5-dioxygenase